MSSSTKAQKPRYKRSINLGTEKLDYLKGVLAAADTKTAAALKLGISKDVLDRCISKGSCNEKTFNILFPEESEQE